MATDIQSLIETPQLIDGRWHPASGRGIDVMNPTRGESLGAVGTSTPADIEAALTAARRAQPEWARLPAVERGKLLRQMADVIARHSDELRDLLVLEVGKPVSQAKDEVAFADSFLRYNAEWDRRLEGEILDGDVAGEEIHLRREPVGVVAAICPWNFPLAVFCRKLGPALLTGNTVVAKPSEVAPLAVLEAVRLMINEVDLPPGVINIVTGAGDTGSALVNSPLTSLISFTGHRDTGKIVMAEASRNLTRVSLELGGKAPAIVWRDADLDLAVSSILAARHTNAGQVCTSAERVFVHQDVADSFTQRYVAAVEALTVGDPADDVDVGPMVSEEQHSKTSAAMARALEEGAQIVGRGADAPAGSDYEKGYWFTPVVLGGIQPGSSVMTEETFGPVTPILPIQSLDEALQYANESRYGLSAYVFSRDYPTVMRTVNDLQFGEIYVNRTLGESVHAHHAGFKESGIGGEDGKWGLLRYTQVKTVYHHYGT